jgi:hypothetical protein
MMARALETGPDRAALNRNIALILSDGLQREKIRFFLECGGLRGVRTYKVESLLTEKHWESTARLNRNRQIDRHHAVVGLAYCDRFITTDKELKKVCLAISGDAGFRLALPQTGAEYIASLNNIPANA